MSNYYFSTTIHASMEEAEVRTRAALEKEGFGVLTEIDVSATLRKKLGVDFRPYKILGACNPGFAHQALSLEDKVGTMLPCNVVLQERPDGIVEIAAVDPVASMRAVENERLASVAGEVRSRLERVIESL